MKKITSLLLTAILLATMLTVFAVPAFAAEKQTVKIPSDVRMHYTGEELVGFEDTDIYTVANGKRKDCGKNYVDLTLRDANKYKWEGTDGVSVTVSFEVHRYFDRDKNGLCDECGKADRNFKLKDSYLDVKLNENNSVITEEKILDNLWAVIEEDKAWGKADTDTWYICGADVTVNNRIDIIGNVHLIIRDGCTLTAKNGIHLKEGNTLSVYAQSDGENQGKLVASSGGGRAAIGGNGSENCGMLNVCGAAVIAEGNGSAGIGGGNGWNGKDGISQTGGGPGKDTNNGNNIDGTAGTAGGNGGTLNVYAGTVTASGSVGIGGGSGGIGGRGALYSNYYGDYVSFKNGKAGRSGNGGNGSNITVYGGTVNASGDTLGIGGGKGGKGNYDTEARSDIISGTEFWPDGEIYEKPIVGADVDYIAGTGGDGGNGGNGGTLTVKGGTVQLYGKVKAAGGGECGGTPAKYKGNGTPGSDTTFDLENCVLKAGSSAESTTPLNNISEYTNQTYLSVQYNTVSFIGSVLSNGNLWIIGGVAVVAIAGVTALVIVKKKKKPALTSGENTDEE